MEEKGPKKVSNAQGLFDGNCSSPELSISSKINISTMDDRIVEIPEYTLVSDGLMQSHKSYKIITKKTDSSDVIQIMRRYSDFQWLIYQLTEKFPGCIIPPVPAKSILTNINQENEEFIESRKHGFKYFLKKMFQHEQLRYAPDFISFVCKNDTEFANLVERSKKQHGFMPKIANIVDYVSSVPGYSFLTNLLSNISGTTDKLKREKTNVDIKIENYESYIAYFEQNATDLANHLDHLAKIERDYSNTMIDIGTNFLEMIKLDKESQQNEADLFNDAAEKNARIQKNHAKQVIDEAEKNVRDISMYVGSAREAIERRNTLIDAIEKNEFKLVELRKQKIDPNKIEEFKRFNEENRRKLKEIDDVLPLELEKFKSEMSKELQQLVSSFLTKQTEHTTKISAVWNQNQYEVNT